MIIIVASCVIGVNKVFFLNPSAESIVGEFSYIGAISGDFDDAVLVVIFVFIAVLIPGKIAGLKDCFVNYTEVLL